MIKCDCFRCLLLLQCHKSLSCVLELLIMNDIYVICRLGGPYSENCDRGLEYAARGRRPRAAFSSPRSQFFTKRNDPKPVNKYFLQALKRKTNSRKKNSRKRYCDRGQRQEIPDRAKNQSDCRIRCRARLEKNINGHIFIAKYPERYG